MKKLTAALVLLALAAVPAAAEYERVVRAGNLDDDVASEQVRTFAVREQGFNRTAVKVVDPCPGGEPYSRRISGTEDSLGRLQLVNADTRTGREVFVDLRSGAAGRSGEARVIAWRRSPGKACGEPRKLFTYDTERRHERPRGASYLANFGATVQNASDAYRGREVVLSEAWARPGEGACCATIRHTRYFRYSVSADRYRLYRTRTSYLPPAR